MRAIRTGDAGPSRRTRACRTRESPGARAPQGFAHVGRAASALLAALVSACAIPLPFEPAADAVPIPLTWSSPGGSLARSVTATDLLDWWSRFGDPMLDAWERGVLQGSPRVRSARAAWVQAQAQRDVAAAALSASVAVTASSQQASADGRSSGRLAQVGLEASWVPDAFGARRAALDAAEAASHAAEATLGDVQVQVTAEAALAYIVLRTSQTRLALAAENLANQRETLQITDWRLQAGLVTSLELEQARAAVAQTEAVLPALESGIQQARHALALLAGLAPAAELAPAAVGPSPRVEVPVAPEELALAIPAETLRQRADVRASEHALMAALARVGQAQAQRAPSFSLSGTLGLQAATLGALSGGGIVASSLLAGIRLPVFDGGGLRAQVRVQQAALDQVRQAHVAVVLGALGEVEDTLAALRRDRLRLVSLKAAAASAGTASLLARQRFGSGLVDFQTVLETQRTQFSSQDAVASAAADLASDQVRLFKALGGGWRDPTTVASQVSTR